MPDLSGRLVFLDTETTGFSPARGDRIVEVAAVAYEGGMLVDGAHGYFHEQIDPERDVPQGAARIHGLTRRVLQGKPKFAEVADSLRDFLRDSHLVMHNAPFDRSFLDAEFTYAGHPELDEIAAGITDTLQMARRMFPGEKNDLDSLCSRCGVDASMRSSQHGALIDAQLLAEVYMLLMR